MLFEVAIVEMPTKKEAEEGKTERLVFGPKCVVAKDKESAGIRAVMGDGNGDRPNIDMDRATVFVRPFA